VEGPVDAVDAVAGGSSTWPVCLYGTIVNAIFTAPDCCGKVDDCSMGCVLNRAAGMQLTLLDSQPLVTAAAAAACVKPMGGCCVGGRVAS
jgi:hypothetical protein